MHVLRLPEVLGIAWSMTALAVLFTLGRFGIHWHRRKRLAWDDFFSGLSLAFLLAFTGTYQVFGPRDYSKQLYGMGLISKDQIPPGNEYRNARYNAANSLLFWCVIYSVKATFLALYWPLFEWSKKFRVAWALVAVYMFLSFGVTFMISFWLCGNPKYFPDTQPYCHEHAPLLVQPMLISWVVLDLVGDVFLMVLPIMMIKPLLMKTSQKIELGVIFSLVMVNMVLTILRTVYSIDVDLLKYPDQNVLWCFLQVTMGVIVCTLPCYRGIMSRKRRHGSVRNVRRAGSGSSEWAEIWQRYLISIGQRSPDTAEKEMEHSGNSGSTESTLKRNSNTAVTLVV